MLAGAAMVPVQVAVSGVSAVPFPKFFSVMIGVHLIIAAVEGIVTFAVILFIHKMRPALVLDGAPVEGKMSARAVAGTFLVVALVVAGFFSLLASGLPDGLEYVLGEHEQKRVLEGPVINEAKVAPVAEAASGLQEKLAPLPDYSKPAADGARAPAWWTSLSGIVGSAIVLALMGGVAWALRRRERARQGAL
jgi:cobalt/nickel transport system permease protein